ncbi:Nin one binding Zn-ribbon like-domain-containing protein [Lasiosphaeris hirsuta]|uniref:20S-pre-rRNA D-site endonuclease NOB1 n=1 Tax=Lasiosphaeris hirsuta TaxID=260670 RepID=A0AA40AQK5_9PEZI|nr:Nin one binding Zn-ribbon like-domain-containing protein [Lasiosphaeris hirsuta]
MFAESPPRMALGHRGTPGHQDINFIRLDLSGQIFRYLCHHPSGSLSEAHRHRICIMEGPPADPTTHNAENIDPAPTIATPVIESPAPPKSTKPVHSLVLDANAIIKNDPAVSTLIVQAEELYTIPAVVSEIRDEATRSRFETTLSPFLKLRSPRPDSVLFVTNFARRTGDLSVLSKPDLHLLALTYELELERNGGDWRLRREPTQKRVNGAPPGRASEEDKVEGTNEAEDALVAELPTPEITNEANDTAPDTLPEEIVETDMSQEQEATGAVVEQLKELDLRAQQNGDDAVHNVEIDEESSLEEDDGDGKWITPSNIKKRQARENTGAAPQAIQRTLQAALITSDMAMRNVALRINLNLLDTGFSRITFLKTWVLRCHGCWKVCKDMTKQFCPSCGQATLTRVSCSTDSAGNFTLHLKRNFQYNNRGNVYSIPKPIHGTASGKNDMVKGGGKNGWGKELILTEDQKEYIRKTEEDRRTRVRDLMDDDYLPSILTGARNSGQGKIKVGAGRSINGKKKR